MIRVPVAIALLALSQSGYTLQPCTLRQWVKRGHISRGEGGYCIREITAYIDRRETRRAA